MVAFSIAVVIFMVTSIVPKITSIFENQEVALPLPTRILNSLSNLFVDYWLLLIILIVAIIISISSFFRTKLGKNWRDKLELKLPFLSGLRIKIMVSRYCQTLGTLLKSGVAHPLHR